MSKYRAVLLGIVVGAFVLRMVGLPDVPPGLNRDEAAIGYTAYSLLETARDEYGKFLPLSFKSFGDWKLPLYIYVTGAFVKFFGLNETAVRLPSAVFGTLAVAGVYMLVKALFANNSDTKRHRLTQPVALLAAGLFAITPWHLFASRVTSEAALAVFLVIGALTLFFHSWRRQFLIVPSFFLLSLTLYTYAGNHLFTPLLFAGLLVLYGRDLLKNRWFLPAVGVLVIMAGIIYSRTLFGADTTKLSGLTVVSDPALVHEQVVMPRLVYSTDSAVGALLHNRPLFLLRSFVQNYLRGFSPEFLFISGGTNTQHNIPNFGNLYLWQAFVIPVGLVFLFANKEKHRHFLLYWLLISPIPAAITRDAPHTARMMAVLPLFAIFTVYGLVQIFRRLKQSMRMPVAIAGGAIILAQFVLFVDGYYIQFPRLAAADWGSGYKQLAHELIVRRNQYRQIVVSRPDFSPYIYYVFYDKTDPQKLQQEAMRYPQTPEGFHHVRQIDNIVFGEIGWGDSLAIPDRLYVDFATGVPKSATASSTIITKKHLSRLNNAGVDTTELAVGSVIDARLISGVRLVNGEEQFYLIETRLQ